MKLTRHNGRAGKNGAYNPKHNDRQFDVANSDHIDQERAKQNVYWDCYQGYRFLTDMTQEDQITYSFEQIEQAFYSERYDDFCEAQHERNRKTGHTGRDRSTKDLWEDKKTCPEESLIQIGTMEKSVSPAVLAEIAAEFFEEFDRRFGKHIHILKNLTAASESTSTSWTGLCIWMKRHRTSMSGTSLTVKTVMVRSLRNRKKRWKLWGSKGRIRTRKRVS